MRSRRLKIIIVTPTPPGSRKGNRITAERWGQFLSQLGHDVVIEESLAPGDFDVLIALHARKSHDAVTQFRRDHPNRTLILALTGTDLYDDIHNDEKAQKSLELADYLIVLQRDGVNELPQHLRGKTRVIYQSVDAPAVKPPPKDKIFEICVVGHLREVKDPFRTAEAARLLPAASKIHVVQIGASLSPEMEARARAEHATNPRYEWLGELPREDVLHIVARSRLLVLTSRLEGGANVVCEALACNTPVISSKISGSIGILGSGYPGYFPVGDTAALAELLHRAETDLSYCQLLAQWCADCADLIKPAHELRAWQKLLNESIDNSSQ